MAKKEIIGYVDVDAGLINIGDPCYLSDGNNSFEDWSKFCDFLGENRSQFDESGFKAIPHQLGHVGKSIVVQTAYGDGTYPVSVTRNKEGRILSVTINFK